MRSTLLIVVLLTASCASDRVCRSFPPPQPIVSREVIPDLIPDLDYAAAGVRVDRPPSEARARATFGSAPCASAAMERADSLDGSRERMSGSFVSALVEETLSWLEWLIDVGPCTGDRSRTCTDEEAVAHAVAIARAELELAGFFEAVDAIDDLVAESSGLEPSRTRCTTAQLATEAVVRHLHGVSIAPVRENFSTRTSLCRAIPAINGVVAFQEHRRHGSRYVNGPFPVPSCGPTPPDAPFCARAGGPIEPGAVWFEVIGMAAGGGDGGGEGYVVARRSGEMRVVASAHLFNI